MKSSGRITEPKVKDIETKYRNMYENILKKLENPLASHIRDCVESYPRIDRISARAKDVGSFVQKACKIVDGKRKYDEPFSQIQDQLGARIITFYLTDVDAIDSIILNYFVAIELKNHVPENDTEFSYFGKHYILLLPEDIIEPDMDRDLIPNFFELQVKTLFQHAWSEAGHDLGYKTGEEPLTSHQKRRIAFTSAQAWGADQIFDELYKERLFKNKTIN